MRFPSLITALVILSAPAAAQAFTIIFHLTGTSTTTLAGATLDTGTIVNATEQSPGSMGPRTVTGSITVDVDNVIAPTSIRFISATLSPDNLATPVQPAIGGQAGSDLAEFGWQFADSSPIGGGTQFMAWRDSIATLSSGVLSVNGSGDFSTTGISFAPIAGRIDLRGHTTGSIINGIPATTNASVANGSYTIDPGTGVPVLMLPNFDITYSYDVALRPGTLHLVGSLTGTIPEPASALLLAGTMGLALQRRKRN